MQFTWKVIWKSEKLPAGQTEKVEVHLQEIKAEHPDSLIVTFFGEKKVELTDDIDVGDTVWVEYNSKVSEYNNRRYNNLNAWKITSIDKSTAVVELKDGGDFTKKPERVEEDFDDLPW